MSRSNDRENVKFGLIFLSYNFFFAIIIIYLKRLNNFKFWLYIINILLNFKLNNNEIFFQNMISCWNTNSWSYHKKNLIQFVWEPRLCYLYIKIEDFILFYKISKSVYYYTLNTWFWVNFWSGLYNLHNMGKIIKILIRGLFKMPLQSSLKYHDTIMWIFSF